MKYFAQHLKKKEKYVKIEILLHCGTNALDKGNVAEMIKDSDECLNTIL